MEKAITALWEILGPIYALLLPIGAALLAEWFRRRYEKVTGVQMDKNYSDLIQGTITRTANAIVSSAGGGRMVTKISDASLDMGVQLVKEAVPDAVAYFRKQGLTDEDIKKKILPQAQAIADATPTDPGALIAEAVHISAVTEALKPVPPTAPNDQAVITDILRGMYPKPSGS